MTETRAPHKYKKGTTYVYFGALLVVIGALGMIGGGGGMLPLLLIVGVVLLVVGVAKKSERDVPPLS